ncbi:MAG: undecaprenyl-diphosphate phosphatase [Saprospiraceae bacterium]|nr:undecaprenyl-diphosphate phosphatase [Saprospiraceae bacterium]
MIDILRSIVLGIIQGLTEFLPVSSSGHLELAKFILGDEAVGEESLFMTVILHFATALSTIVIFRKFIWDIILSAFSKSGKYSRNFIVQIIISMIPAAFVGVFMDDLIEQMFNKNILLVCSMLIITGLLLYVADRAKNTNKKVGPVESIIIGVSQAIAILPGISRSGATISTSVLLGIDREEAARFSFLMVVPLIFGKIAKDLLDDSFSMSAINAVEVGSGFIAAFITGLIACTWMIALVKKSQLKYFSYYCFAVALIGFIYIAFT